MLRDVQPILHVEHTESGVEVSSILSSMPAKTRGSTEGTRKRKAEEDQANRVDVDRDEFKEESEVDGDKQESSEEARGYVKEEGMYHLISDCGIVC
jgi:hypothetical protein